MKYLIIFLLAGCGHKIVNEAVFDSYKELFTKYAKQQGEIVDADIPIMFGDMPREKVAGYCQKNEPVHIVISIKYWNEFSDEQKEVLIFHELGHGVLNREHENINADGECPESIMNWQVLQTYCYKQYKQRYIKELFQ